MDEPDIATMAEITLSGGGKGTIDETTDMTNSGRCRWWRDDDGDGWHGTWLTDEDENEGLVARRVTERLVEKGNYWLLDGDSDAMFLPTERCPEAFLNLYEAILEQYVNTNS
jgi:hypothetical protein